LIHQIRALCISLFNPEVPMGRRASQIAAALAGVILSAAMTASPVSAEADIGVVMNQAKILKLTRPADTIVVGNPAIADASVQDAHTIVLTGKGFGITNLVVLDKSGSPIVDAQVVVSRATPIQSASIAAWTSRRFPARPIARAPTRTPPRRPPKRS
jgi:Flp pilus assembly secretin CpaC